MESVIENADEQSKGGRSTSNERNYDQVEILSPF